ncbi:Aminoalkylphosphonate N-acetyltransferase [Andreprevotia sp. IGB-42]|uniref:GNAT family N-acetyltransferase n=1 Tax=Andreprevotia sp. IGB-42 TaxID=2497473 RepID=UPI001356E71B|nr:GNAT family N-acetyltransferase [Andreprevotia sp. IGB-42]KAF0814696.1 Aminoalkylphosphonate N-acetyltransferase [Andreprevotia sp. IGB-42]
MLIRPVVDDDAAAICPLLADLGYPSDEAAVRVRLANLERAGGYACLVADDGGRLVGLVLLAQAWMIELDGMQVRIVALVVDEHARGQGIGVALMDEAERWARAHGATSLQLNSGTHRPEAHAFYERRGFANNGLRFYKKIGSDT